MNYKRIIGACLVVLIMASTAGAEWNSKFGIGARGPFMAPLFKGSDYAHFQGSYEPFMMGWDGALEIKYGMPRKFVVNLSIGYATTYDDTMANADQSFKMNKSDRAYSKLTGILLGLTGQYLFIPEGSVQPYLLAGLGLDMWTMETLVGGAGYPSPLGSKYKFSDLGLKGGAGINFWLGENFTLDLQGKLTYDIANVSTSGDPTIYGDMSDMKIRPFAGYFEPSIGLTYFIGGAPDRDRDGIKDKFDQCPDTPIGATVDQYGCPLDSDRDAVYDGIDTCLETPQGCVVDITGCPLDTDKDGVCDGLDKCPESPESVAVDVRGCPLDGDADGVPDFKDQQPETPRGATVDENGIAIDSDADSIPDGIDKCPDTGAGILVDEFGCPRAKPLTGTLTLNIQYESGSFEPDAQAKLSLDELALTMQSYPNLRIEVNGYTDALGSISGNLRLSQKRSDAVKEYLINKGVSPDRVSAKGFGEETPVADNGTPEGRQKNRRIEIVPLGQ
jgi:outer membrane protein OmpA-like peptidoglycan-associated protein/opacity protein-like surface antigen